MCVERNLFGAGRAQRRCAPDVLALHLFRDGLQVVLLGVLGPLGFQAKCRFVHTARACIDLCACRLKGHMPFPLGPLPSSLLNGVTHVCYQACIHVHGLATGNTASY